jgi:predicted kinase
MVILVFGFPGTGKTYFASRLAEKIKAVHYNSDNIRKKIGKWDKYDEASKMNTYDALLEKMRDAIQRGKNVVLDATFYKQELRDNFQRAAKELKQPLIMIEVKAAEETIRQRLSKPRTDSQADYKVYEKVRAEFEPVTEDHLELHSDEDSPESMLTQALNYLAGNDK